MYKKLNEMLAEGYLETKFQDEVAASLGVNEASGEDMGINKNKAKEGVYILHINGKLYEVDLWNSGSKDAVGVALITKKCKFVIAPDMKNGISWSKEYVEVADCFTTDLINIVRKDTNGNKNTRAIIKCCKKDSQDECAAKYCANYIFRNGKKGYLGTLGETYAMYQNLNAINTALNKIGGTPIPTSGNGYVLWSSTQYDATLAWTVFFNYGNVTGLLKNSSNASFGVRPLAAI